MARRGFWREHMAAMKLRLAPLLFGCGGAEVYRANHISELESSSSSPNFPSWASVGLPGGDTYYSFKENLVICYDARTRNAKWVTERLTKESIRGDASRKVLDFYEDDLVDRRFRAKNSDFFMSGYDRGHLAPAADHKNSIQAMKNTFSLSNISPQVGAGFNRDYWARFEIFCRDLTRSVDRVYVVTGPLFLPRLRRENEGHSSSRVKFIMNYELLGEAPELVAVPTHFYKVILTEQNGQCLVAAFVLPNTPIPPNLPLTGFLVPLDNLERTAGLRFFPQYLSEERRELLDSRLGSIRGQIQGPPIAGLLTDGSAASAAGKSGSRAGGDGDREKRGWLTGWGGREKGAGGMIAVQPRHLCEVLKCELPEEGGYGKATRQLEGRRARLSNQGDRRGEQTTTVRSESPGEEGKSPRLPW